MGSWNLISPLFFVCFVATWIIIDSWLLRTSDFLHFVSMYCHDKYLGTRLIDQPNWWSMEVYHMLNLFFHLMAQTPSQKQLYIYIILHICIRTHIIYIQICIYIYIICIYTFENTSTSTPKIHTDHFGPCAGPFKPSSLPPTSNPTRSAICKAMRGDWWELHVKWFLWRFFFGKFDTQDPKWKPVFLYLESLYIKKRYIYIYIHNCTKRQIKTYVFATGRQERKLKEKEWRRQI